MRQRIGILVGGGPAPGINGVIAALTTEAVKSGLSVVGIYDGYRDLAAGTPPRTRELTIDDVALVQTRGGSVLRTSRTNPAADAASLDRTIAALHALDLRYLACIGGDDTTFGAAKIAARTTGSIGVVTVPKTIDNDLPLPDNAPTFGFETARSVGASIVENLIEDARTTSRWYIVISMGRKSGALALGICNAAGATLAAIPEEYPLASPLARVVDTIVGSMLKRRLDGHDDGVAVVAEGIAERLAPDALADVGSAARDAFGNVRLADIPLGTLIREGIRRRLDALGVDLAVTTKDIGYELRCAKPVAFDVDYTRALGYGAARYLLDGGSGALIALSGGRLAPLRLEELLDPASGRIRTRLVDTGTEAYRVARDAMVRLEAADLEGARLRRLAALTCRRPAELREIFAAVALH